MIDQLWFIDKECMSLQRHRELWIVGSLVTASAWLCLVGCSSRPARVEAPAWSPSSMGQAAVDQLDKSGDSLVDKSEVAAAPGLADVFAVLDSDRSGALSSTEIAARFELYERMRTATAYTTLVIKLNGRPLKDAFVKLVPESFQGDVVSPATGMTNHFGEVSPQTVGKSTSGMEPGLFRVELYRDKEASQPIAVKTPLGVESSEFARGDGQTVATLNFEAGS
jgi:hypothetical protein